MNKWIWFLRGFFTVKLSGATPQWALNRLGENRIPFWSVQWQDDFTVIISIPRSYLSRAKQSIEQAMCQIISHKEIGFPTLFQKALHRPVLLLFVFLALLTIGLLPQYVLFYQVIGNENVPKEEIIRALDDIGISFGIYGPDINPEKIGNQVLKRIPELQWITVNQNGCRAQVIVRERPQIPETYPRKGLANIIASRSGIITEQSVMAGQAIHQVGDTVLEGDLLVSGMVDLERTCTVEHARAEIYARTWRDSETVIPETHLKKTYTGKKETTVWLCIGEKRMKIFGNSGISPWNCDKITDKKPLQLPGGLTFPILIEIETAYFYEPQPETMPAEEAAGILQTYTELSADKAMIAGQILQRQHRLDTANGCHRLNSVLECHEMIAKTVEMQWNTGGESRDRTNGKRRESGTDH